MIDLTGANLVNYLLRMIRDIVERNPRAITMADAIDFKRRDLNEIEWLHDHSQKGAPLSAAPVDRRCSTLAV